MELEKEKKYAEISLKLQGGLIEGIAVYFLLSEVVASSFWEIGQYG